MKFELRRPAIYLITTGEVTAENFSGTRSQILTSVAAAVEYEIPLVQVREKQLSGRLLFELSRSVIEMTRGTATGVFINDRADIAAAAGADGVHLTSTSLSPTVVRRIFPELAMGVSVHGIEEIAGLKAAGADFAMLGPVFSTPGKGEPLGLQRFAEACREAGDLPVIGVGGIDASNFQSILDSGAAGFAAIRSLNDPDEMRAICGATSK